MGKNFGIGTLEPFLGYRNRKKQDWGAEMNSAPQTPHLLFLAYWRGLLPHSQVPRRCRAENGAIHASP